MSDNVCFNGIKLLEPDKDEAEEFNLYSIPTQQLIFQRPQTNQRFAEPVTQTEIDQKIADRVPKNTKKANSWALKVWRDWAFNRNAHPRTVIEPRFQKVPNDPLLCGQEELDFWLCRFIVEIRREDGSEYPPTTLLNITSGLQRHMRENGRPETLLLSKNNAYVPTFQKAIDFRMKELTAKGIGIHRKQADPVTETGEEQLWNTKTFDINSAKGLSYAVFYYNCKLFGFRGMDEHRDLCASQFKVTYDYQSRKRKLEFFGRASKNFQGGYNQRKVEAKHIVQWEDPGNPRDLLSLYDKFLSCIPRVGSFYRRPLEQTNSENCTPRFSAQVIGVNKLSTYVKCMFSDAAINSNNRNISNHSGKVTCATTLYNCGFDNKAVAGRSGHRSNAVEAYKRPAQKMLNEVSMALQPPKPEHNKENISSSVSSNINNSESSATSIKKEEINDENTLKVVVPKGIKKIVIEKDGKCYSLEI